MEYRMPGLPVTYHLLEFAQVHVHCISDAIQPPIFSFCPWSFPASGTFPVSRLFTSDDQNIGASASAPVLPVNIQGWSPLRLIGLISLLFKGHRARGLLQHLSSKASILWQSALFKAQLSQPFMTDHWGDHSLDFTDLCQQTCLCFSTHCLGLSSVSCQEIVVFPLHGCSHHLQWFWSPRRGNLLLFPPFLLLLAMQ